MAGYGVILIIQYFSEYLIKAIESIVAWRAITIGLIFNLSAGERRESGRYVKFIVGGRCPLTNVSQRGRTGGQCSFPIFIPPPRRAFEPLFDLTS